MPGNASGGLDGVALKPLTVSFSEPGFASKLAQENQFGPWFTLSNKERQQLGSPMGPANPQSLNRYSYVQNNPLKYTDPSGHTIYITQDEARVFVGYLKELATELRKEQQGLGSKTAQIVASAGRAFSGTVGRTLANVIFQLASLGWENVAMIWELADTIERINNESPDGVALAGGANSAYEHSSLYILNRTTGTYETIQFSYFSYQAVIGAGNLFDIGAAFGDDIRNGHFAFEADMDNEYHFGNPCPVSSSSC